MNKNLSYWIPQQLLDKYKERPIIVPEYYSVKNKFYTIQEIKTIEGLLYCLGEVNDHESRITKEGICFFKSLGFKKMANLLFEEQWRQFEYQNSKEIEEWFIWWESQYDSNIISDSHT